MQTRVKFKNLYLIAVITIGLIGLGVGSTFAMFTATANIENPIALSSNLSSTNVLAETIEVTVPAGEDKEVDLVVSNASANTLRYTAWYMPSSNDLDVGSISSNNSYGPTGTIPSAGSFTLTVQLRNTGNTPITVTLGVSSSSTDIVLATGMTQIPARFLPMLSDYDYILGSDQTTITTLSTDFYNQSTQTISEQSNVTLPASISISQNEVLLIRYIGSRTQVNVPNTFNVDGTNYNVVLLSYVVVNDNLKTGVFFRNTDIESVNISDNVDIISLNSSDNGFVSDSARGLFTGCTSLETVSGLSNTITSMYYTFSGCTSMETAPTLPTSVTNIGGVFSGCTNLTSINLSNIDLDDITEYASALNGVSTTATITVGDCLQYRSFTSKFGYNHTGLTVADINNPNYTCNYQEVKYIQSDTNSYIDTGVLDSNNNLEIYVKANVLSYSGYGYIFGTWTNDNQANTVCYASSSTGRIGCWINKAYSANAMTPFTVQQDFEILVNKDQFKYNETIKDSFVTGTSRSPLSIYVFRRNGTPMQSTSIVAKLYKMQIKDNNVLIRNFVPCYSLTTVTNSKGVQVPSGTIGLYDTVNNVFYTNSGSGNFVAGFLPSEYQQVEYIQSTGTQYIDTGVKATTTQKFEIDIKINDLSTNGALIAGWDTTKYSQLCFNTNVGGWIVQWGSTWDGYGTKDTLRHMHILDLPNAKYSIDTDNYSVTTPIVNESSDKNMYILAGNNNGSLYRLTKANLYSFKIYDDNVLIRNFVPCYRKVDGVVGMYDIVNDVFYTNANTAANAQPFTKGADVNS